MTKEFIYWFIYFGNYPVYVFTRFLSQFLNILSEIFPTIKKYNFNIRLSGANSHLCTFSLRFILSCCHFCTSCCFLYQLYFPLVTRSRKCLRLDKWRIFLPYFSSMDSFPWIDSHSYCHFLHIFLFLFFFCTNYHFWSRILHRLIFYSYSGRVSVFLYRNNSDDV